MGRMIMALNDNKRFPPPFTSQPKPNQRKVVSHAEFAALLLAMQPKVAEIKQRMADGLYITALCDEYKTSQWTMKSLLSALGIEYGRKTRRLNKIAPETQAILTVLQRICEGLQVPHDEILPFL